jgi:hypothetical protein
MLGGGNIAVQGRNIGYTPKVPWTRLEATATSGALCL